MIRFLALLYGIACYLCFALVGLYAVGFVTDSVVPRSVNRGIESSPAVAVSIDLLLIGLFAAQHSGMARRSFKRWWTRLIPAVLERSTYVLASSLALALIFWQWRPIPAVVWDVAGSPAAVVIRSIGIAAAGIMAWASFQIDHLDLFGLRQVHDHAMGRPTVSPPFQTPGLYRWVRHPMMLGLLAAMWAVPTLTAGHLLFNAGLSLYVLIAIRFEERDLLREFGEAYVEYQRRVPMLWPGVRGQVPVNSGSGPPVAPG